MKQFLKMMFASALGIVIAIGLCCALSLGILVGILSSMEYATYTPKANTVWKLTLSGELPEDDANHLLSMLTGKENSTSLRALLEAIGKAKANEHIKGIYVEANGLSTGTAGRQTLRRALEDFKTSGKFIVAYADIYTQGDYFLCSVADKVFMNPQGMVELTGLSSQRMFYKGLFDKIGVHYEVFKVGAYKGAVEPYTLDNLSDANREQMQSYTTSVWSNIADGIASGRKLTVEKVNSLADEGILLAPQEKLVDVGLVDALKYRDEAEDFVRELAEQTDDELQAVGTDRVRNILSVSGETGGEIAILYAEGEITEEKYAAFSGNENVITEALADELSDLKDNENVKAVVFRVNSPGGSAYISEQIWHQVAELKKIKPVVVSMGNVAASGGYYISCAASKIIAEPATLTGSIGIFACIPIVEGTLQKIGVTTDGVKTNRFADMGDISRPFREDERQLMQAYIERGYDLFLNRCADGRGMSREAMDSLAQGRVWTGEQALEKGLVDALGGLDTAVASAAGLAGLDTYYVTHVSVHTDFLQDFIEKQFNNLQITLAKNLLGADYEYVRALRNARLSGGTQARLPYDMKPL